MLLRIILFLRFSNNILHEFGKFIAPPSVFNSPFFFGSHEICCRCKPQTVTNRVHTTKFVCVKTQIEFDETLGDWLYPEAKSNNKYKGT